MMKAMLLVLTLLFTSACSSLSATDFDRGPSSDEQYSKDVAECEFHAENAKTTDGYGGLAAIARLQGSYNNTFEKCMTKLKGYKRKE